MTFSETFGKFPELFWIWGKNDIFRDFWKVSRMFLNMGKKWHFQRLLENFQNFFKYGEKITFSETFGKFPEFFLNMGEKLHFQTLFESFQNFFKYGEKITFSETFGKFPEIHRKIAPLQPCHCNEKGITTRRTGPRLSLVSPKVSSPFLSPMTKVTLCYCPLASFTN